MRVAIVGRGKMAEEVRRLCRQECVETVDLGELRAGDVVLHFGSGRELPAALAACARAGVPLIQGSTSISLPEPLPATVVEAPNLALAMIRFMGGLQALAGHVTAIRESHQAGKRDVSGTAKVLARRLGFAQERIESVRDSAAQLAVGVPAEDLDGHAYHWIEAMQDGVQVSVVIRIHGRDAYARGAMALARALSGRTMQVRRYSVEEVLD